MDMTEDNLIHASVPTQAPPIILSILEADGAIDPRRVHLCRGPSGIIRATIEGDRSLLRTKVVRLFPLSNQTRYISILDAKDKEVCLIKAADHLDTESQRLIKEELARFYFITTITQIRRLRHEYRTLYWDVETERGERDFVVKWSTDTVLWLTAKTVQLEDVDGNRFLIPDVEDMDPPSRKFIALLQ